ncbi:MAG TPA: DegT/DnrJ/EryC1/StrS family aminotransferase [Candidatus Sumerlaeota bacterium]|nr:DegT/DnrJ/EryC1/StrS family aminotransferase [Candidatus Sumerlaeota bacterium]HPK02118.1 DegT/DnrJ/EryC1/StrS family aminotransferase [Candidatus Sumerlaeota bacterium]
MSQLRVPLTDVTLGAEEAAAAARVIRSGWLTMGAEVEAFEREFADAIGAQYAVAVTNGTAALQLAYRAAGLGLGDHFAIPALTFVATMNAGLALGGRPILIDCTDENDLTLSPDDLECKITGRTRLIVTMAYGGFAPDMDRILGLAEQHGIAVVEDNAHAPLARLDVQCLGTFGMAACYSFFGNKNMTTGEGGMIVTDNEAVAAELRLLRSHGMTHLTWERHQGHAAGYDVLIDGYNARMDEVRAAIGREQLRKLPAANEARARAARKLRERLIALEINGLRIPFWNPRGEPVHHLFVILLPPRTVRDAFRAALMARGVQTSIHYPPLNSFTHARQLFGSTNDDLPVLQSIADRLVTLPLGPTLTEEQIDWVAESVRLALK